MEPSLYRYVLRQSWRQQIVLVLLALVSFPFLYVFYELPKTIVNRAIAPETAHFPVSLLGFELSQRDYLLALCGGLLLLVFVNQGFKYAINVYKGITAEKILRQMRADLYARILKFPLPVFRRMSQGKIIPMITGEVETLGGFFGDVLGAAGLPGRDARGRARLPVRPESDHGRGGGVALSDPDHRHPAPPGSGEPAGQGAGATYPRAFRSHRGDRAGRRGDPGSRHGGPGAGGFPRAAG